MEELNFDKYADFYYTNLINAIILFSLSPEELDKLAAPTFDPLFELESELDYAYTPICFETIFRNNVVEESLKPDLLKFKQSVDEIPGSLWEWDCLERDATWAQTRQNANDLLEKLNVKDRTYNEDYTTVYDSKGNLLKRGKRLK